jgi:hypothetical protein
MVSWMLVGTRVNFGEFWGGKVPFTSLCKSDPIMDFLRSTYDAIPMRVPDSRIEVFTIFAAEDKKVRYLGDFKHLPGETRWSSLRTVETELADVSKNTSSTVSLSVLLDLLGPFVSAMTGVPQLNLPLALSGSRHRDIGARITLTRTKRMFIPPITFAAAFNGSPAKLPEELRLTSSSEQEYPLFVVDAVLSAKEITLTMDGDTSEEVGLKLEEEIAGKTSAEYVLRSKSRLVITGKKRAPFAFTCLQLDTNENKEIIGVRPARKVPRLGATGVQTNAPAEHVGLGGPDELLSFDD